MALEVKSVFRILNDDLYAFDSQILFSTNFRLDFKYNWQSFIDTSNKDNTEYFQIHTGLILLRFAQNEKVQFRSGIGINNILFANNEGHFGFNFTYGLDFYPTKPLAGSAFFELGTLGHARYLRGRLEFGLVRKNCGINLTFEYTEIGDERIYGPGIGIKLIF